MSKKKAIVLLSGGLDSTTTLYQALDKGYQVHGLILDYGQRHKKEIRLAQAIARKAKCPSEVVKINLPWKGSSLLDKQMHVPDTGVQEGEIPSTYVPGRNIIFLSFAISYAEAVGATHVFIGANAIDYSGYPDCRPEFFKAYEQVVKTGLKAGVEGKRIKIEVPLLKKTKAQIIRLGLKLNVPYEMTWSCYNGTPKPCRVCDSCRLREEGFIKAGSMDPLLKKKK